MLHVVDSNVKPLTLCILKGREEEMEIFMSEVEKVINNKSREHGVIVLAAVDGMGKSKLMRAMKSRASREGFRCTNILL